MKPLDALPHWTPRTVGVLCTLGDGPHAIPVSAPVRAADHRVLINLHRERASLARLRADPRVALVVLTEGDVAFTARGRAHVLEDPMAVAADYVAVEIAVEHVDDHRQASFVVQAGIDRRWVDEEEQRGLGRRVRALKEISAQR